MKKRIICAILTFVLAFSNFCVLGFADEGINVTLNGELLTFDVSPQSINGRTMVPMRKIFEAMGAIVNWDNENQIVTAVKDDITVIMQINNAVIRVNNDEILLDVPPQVVDSRTLVPARAVAESLNAEVLWDGETKTVIITEKNIDSNIDDNVKDGLSTDFLCLPNPTILYGIDDIWYGTIGTGMTPSFTQYDKAYKGQVVMIAPLFANFMLDESSNVNVTFDIKVKNPSGEETVMATDLPALSGLGDNEVVMKSIYNLEYVLEDGDELGTYTFTIESKDNIANKTNTSTFDVEFTEYKYEKNEFKSENELLAFIRGYGLNPEPERIIDAIIFAEKNNVLFYPIIFGSLVEMYAKNQYIVEEATAQIEKEFGPNGTEMTQLLDETATMYYQSLMENDPPTMTNVSFDYDVDGDIMGYGMNMGIYFASCSYDVAVALAESYARDNFSDEQLTEYGLPRFEELFENDPLFMAYCYSMIVYDDYVSDAAKDKLITLFQ